MRSSICFIMPAQLHGTQEHQEISPLRYGLVEMTKEGTRGQLRGSHEHQEIPPRFAMAAARQVTLLETTKKGVPE